MCILWEWTKVSAQHTSNKVQINADGAYKQEPESKGNELMKGDPYLNKSLLSQ
jgi:hypothetical protein